MLDLQVDQESVSDVFDHFDAVRDRILDGVRIGMKEAMRGLAETVASKFDGNPIVNRSGSLLAAVLASPRVWENSTTIGGNIGGDPDDAPGPLDLWLEYGHEYPGKRKRYFEEQNLRKNPLLRAAANARRLEADRVPAHPYMYPSLDQYGPTILQIIQERVADAME